MEVNGESMKDIVPDWLQRARKRKESRVRDAQGKEAATNMSRTSKERSDELSFRKAKFEKPF